MTDHYSDAERYLQYLVSDPPRPDSTETEMLCDVRLAMMALTHAVLSVTEAMPNAGLG